VVDPATSDPVRAIVDATGGRGVDVAFEAAGALDTPEQASRGHEACVTVVIVGICADDRIPLRATPARKKEITIKVSQRIGHVYARTIALVDGRMVDVRSLVTHFIPLAPGGEAFALLDGDQDGVGKVAIVDGGAS